jgi:hypothetical protein
MTIEKQYKLVNGVKVEFSQADYAQAELDKIEFERTSKPIAKANDLLKFLVETVKEQSNQENLKPFEKSIKINKFQNVFTKWKFSDTQTGDLWTYLQVEEGNFTQAEFDSFLKSIVDSQALNNGNGKKQVVDIVIALINQWKESVRFEI